MVTVMQAMHTIIADIYQRERQRESGEKERERVRESVYCNCDLVSTTQDLLRCSSFLFIHSEVVLLKT